MDKIKKTCFFSEKLILFCREFSTLVTICKLFVFFGMMKKIIFTILANYGGATINKPLFTTDTSQQQIAVFVLHGPYVLKGMLQAVTLVWVVSVTWGTPL